MRIQQDTLCYSCVKAAGVELLHGCSGLLPRHCCLSERTVPAQRKRAVQLSCSTLGYPYVALCSAGVVKVLKYGMVVLQVTQEVAALSAVATMDELLEASELIDESLGLRYTAPPQQTSGSRP